VAIKVVEFPDEEANNSDARQQAKLKLPSPKYNTKGVKIKS